MKDVLSRTVRQETSERMIHLGAIVAPGDPDFAAALAQALEEAAVEAAVFDPELTQFIPTTLSEDDLEDFVTHCLAQVGGAEELTPEQEYQLRYRCEHEYCLRQLERAFHRGDAESLLNVFGRPAFVSLRLRLLNVFEHAVEERAQRRSKAAGAR